MSSKEIPFKNLVPFFTDYFFIHPSLGFQSQVQYVLIRAPTSGNFFFLFLLFWQGGLYPQKKEEFNDSQNDIQRIVWKERKENREEDGYRAVKGGMICEPIVFHTKAFGPMLDWMTCMIWQSTHRVGLERWAFYQREWIPTLGQTLRRPGLFVVQKTCIQHLDVCSWRNQTA